MDKDLTVKELVKQFDKQASKKWGDMSPNFWLGAGEMLEWLVGERIVKVKNG